MCAIKENPMTISNRFTPRSVSPVDAIETSRVSNSGPSPLAKPAVKASGGRAIFSEKLGGFRAEALSAGLRLFSDTSVTAAMDYVKSAVSNLAGSMASAFGAVTGRASPVQVAPEPDRQAPPRSIAQDPGFGAAFDKWVQDNKFDGAKPTPAKPANEGISRARVALPNARPASAVAAARARGELSPRTGEPDRQAPPRSIAQDPGFGAAFDKWIQDNKLEGAKPTPAKPANEGTVPTPVTLPSAKPTVPSTSRLAKQVPGTRLGDAAKPPPVQQLSAQPATTAAQPPTPAAAPAYQAPASPADGATAMLLNRKQGLNSSQSGLLGLMSQLGEIKQSKEKASTLGDKIPARTATESVVSEAAHGEPRGKVYTNPAAFAKALDKWERDNHFDHDNPMPAGHVSEPRPEFKSTARLADRSEALPSAAEVEARRQTEINSHQEAVNAGYR